MIFCGGSAGTREAGVAGGSPPESSGKKRIPEWLKNAFLTERNPHRKRAIERMNNALCHLRTLAEFREPYLLLKRYGIPLVPLNAPILDFQYKNNSTQGISEPSDPSRWWEWEDFWLSPILEEFGAYLERVKNRRLVFRDEGGNIWVLPYETRFHRSYQRKLSKRFEDVVLDWGLLLTLTTDLNQYSDIISAVKTLKRVWNRVLSGLRRRYGRVDFFTALEFSFKRGHGACHLHVVLLHITHLDLNWLRERVGSHARWLHVRRFRNLRLGGKKGYLTKYLRKQVVGFASSTSSVAFKNSSLLWFTNARGWSCSRNFMRSVRREPAGWEFIGCFPASVAEHPAFIEFFPLFTDPELWVFLRRRRKYG